jgi:hypothetical protein
LIQELADEDVDGYISIQRVCPALFKEILDRIDPFIRKQDTFYRDALPPALKLSITLSFFATGRFLLI